MCRLCVANSCTVFLSLESSTPIFPHTFAFVIPEDKAV